ncbi:zinc finger protein 438 [Protopterus annectens]|uniref:zinc finger protein 438 n=1 Tax=Protopterus annectens TaxID=7888 RepID=UPI001CF9E653|nr:zinc finger protein 438 [Protopterus annectens]
MQKHATASSDTHDGSKPASRTIYQKKGMQAKSYFRNIAPKIGAEFQPSPGFPYTSSLPDIQTSHLLINGPKSVVMPAHNYALMQVPGQETTYSLVAVPQASTSSPGHSTQSVQMSSISVPENYKLPIPRYQSVRSKTNADKRLVQTAISAMPLKAVEQMQTKASVQNECLPPPAVHPRASSAVDSSEQVLLIDSSAEEFTVATLVTDSTSVESEPLLANKCENDKQVTSTCLLGSSKKDKLPSLVRQDVSVKQSADTLVSSNESAMCPAVKIKKPEEASVVPANPITVLSPAIFGNTAQLFPSVPKGKIPILPYSRVKKSSNLKPKQKASVTNKSSKSGKVVGKITSACTTLTSILGTVVDMSSTLALQHTSKQATCRSLVASSEKFATGVLKRQHSATSKRRGRKRSGADQIKSSQVKKMKYGNNVMRKCKEKTQLESKEAKAKNTDVFKKYRSIRPKPLVVMQTPLASFTNLIPSDTGECMDQEYTLNAKTLTCQQCGSTSLKHPSPYRIISRQWFKCHICNRGFQLKHHLRDHMNTHTNSRPYTCRICRKTYVHSGSLSTHMKLHHGENHLKKKIHCGFCSKCFGHVGVYFGHLKEVHKVIINVVPCPTQQKQDSALKENEYCCSTTDSEVGCMEKDNSSAVELPPQDSLQHVRLQIRCYRCNLITPTIADMKLHLLQVHKDKVKLRLKEGVLHGNTEAEEELIKHAAHHWMQLNETINQARCRSGKDKDNAFSKQKPHCCFYQDTLSDSVGVKLFCLNTRTVSQKIISDGERKEINLWTTAGINCILCKQIFERKEEVMLHWQNYHSCENPAVLWHIFNSFSEHEVIEESVRSTENETTSEN